MSKLKKLFKTFISDEESGAIVIETTVAFALFLWFVFVIFHLLYIITVQSAITRGIHQFTMDMSQASYLYYEFMPGNKAITERNNTYTEVNKSVEEVQGAYEDVNTELSFSSILNAGSLLNQALNGITSVVGGAEGDSTSSQIGSVLTDLARTELESAIFNLMAGQALQISMNINLRYNSVAGDAYLENFKVENFSTMGSSIVGGPIHMELNYDIGLRGLSHFFPGVGDWKITQGVSAYTNPWRGK